jgi:hypothetical protein
VIRRGQLRACRHAAKGADQDVNLTGAANAEIADNFKYLHIAAQRDHTNCRLLLLPVRSYNTKLAAGFTWTNCG